MSLFYEIQCEWMFSACEDTQKKCDNNLCVHESVWCDSENNCEDWSDEINCSKFFSIIMPMYNVYIYHSGTKLNTNFIIYNIKKIMWRIFIKHGNLPNYINITISVPNQVCKIIKFGKVRMVMSTNTPRIWVIMLS